MARMEYDPQTDRYIGQHEGMIVQVDREATVPDRRANMQAAYDAARAQGLSDEDAIYASWDVCEPWGTDPTVDTNYWLHKAGG